jgi:hypothetical protein
MTLDGVVVFNFALEEGGEGERSIQAGFCF